MANIKVTEKLASLMKEERIKHDLSARQLSERLGKSVSYISSLERCKIDFIDSEIFIEIFKIILNTSEKEFNDYMNNLMADISVELTEKEFDDKKWILQFNLVIRQTPITQDIIDYIKNKLDELNKTPEDLVRKINENTYLDITDIKENELIVYKNTEGLITWSYKFKLENKFIDDILEKKLTTINYINMMGIIYNLFLFEGFDNSKAMESSKDFLKEHKFYTLDQILDIRRKNLIKKISSTTDILKDSDFSYSIDLELPEYETEFEKQFEDLEDTINLLRDKDIENALKVIKTINKNIKFDYKFMMAMLQLPIHALEKTTIDERQEFLFNIAKSLKETVNKNTKNNLE